MADETLVLAIVRLDQALTRVETRLATGGGAGTDAALAERHRRLRTEAKTAADRLDALIAGIAEVAS